MNDICIPAQYSPYVNKSMQTIKNLASSNLFIGIGLLILSFVLIHKIINVILIIALLYLVYLLWLTHKEKIINWLEKLPKPQYGSNLDDDKPVIIPASMDNSVEHFSTDKIYSTGLDNVISGDIEIPDKTQEIKNFNYEQDNAMMLATWYPNTYIEKIDENGEPVYNSRDNKFHVPSMELTLTRDGTRNAFNEIDPINMDGIADNNYGMSLKDLYDKSVPNYKKIEKPMILDKSNDIIKTGASNLSSYSPEDWSYKNEKELNGGLVGDNLYASDDNNDLLNSVATF